MRGIKRILGSNGLRALDPDEEAFDDVTFETKDLLNHDPAWKLDVPKYYNYKDVLAADLLSIWDFEPPEDMNDITLNSTTIQSQSQREQVPKAITKVNNWFMQMNSTAVHESEPFEVKMDQTITTNTPEIPEVPKEEPTTSKPKIPKTNRPKFLKGF